MTSTVGPGRTKTVPTDDSRLTLGSSLMVMGGLAFLGYAVAFFVQNFSDEFLEMGIGPGQVDVGRDQIQDFSPQLYDYVSHLHIAVAGFIAATAIAVIALAWFGVRRGLLWAWIGAVVAPVVGLAVALPSHYAWGFDTLGHLGAIYLATAVYVAGALLALPSVLRAGSRDEMRRSG